MLSAAQFNEWVEFYSLEPWGFDIDDARHAMINSSVLRAAGAKTVRPEMFSMAPKKQETRTEMLARVAGLLGAVIPDKVEEERDGET